jgi:hypothetical protein
MNVELGEIYTIKIANGDELVTRITAATEHTYTIVKPLTVVPGPQGVQLIHSLFTGDSSQGYSLNKNACMIVAPSRREVYDSYVEATTGIKPVTNKILMG